jgi:shikimate dehydrogenase
VQDWPAVRVHAYSRTPARTVALARRFPFIRVAQSVGECLEESTLVINATPLGLSGSEMPVDVGALPRDAAVMDLAYRPGLTPWTAAARDAGHRAADGLEMLIAQGAEAFERWFGRPPDRDVMRAALPA